MSNHGDEVRILVVAAAPEPASQINSALRARGVLAQVSWAADLKDAREQLADNEFDLLFGAVPECDPAKLAALGDAADPAVPAVGVADEIDDTLLEASLGAGLRDLVLVSRASHLAAVAQRELRALSSLRAARAGHAKADSAHREREAMFTHSGDALAVVEDGIVVRANAAWADLFGVGNEQPGTPVLDLFDKDSHAALRASLRARPAQPIDVNAKSGDGARISVSLAVRVLQDGGSGHLELAIRSGRGQRTMAEELERARRQDVETGLLNRNAFIETLGSAASRSLILIRIDQFARIVEQMGVMGSNDVAIQFARLVTAKLPKGAVAGRIDGTMLGVTLPESADEAVTAWCEEVRAEIGKATFDNASRSTHLTASFGIRGPGAETGEIMLDDALAALRTARSEGGNRIDVYRAVPETAAATDTLMSDADWANRIKIALVKGHFRVALQAVASLRGDTTDTNDLLLRLQDPERGEILPGEFLPAAERVGLTTFIDRWVLHAATKLLADGAHRKRGTTLFVRLTDDSIADPGTLKWLDARFAEARPDPGRLVIEISTVQARERLRETKRLVTFIKKQGCGVLLSRFGTDPQSTAMLTHIPANYVKLDIDVVSGIARDQARQKSLAELAETLRDQGIQSLAPQVEDANAMAALWQAGVDFVQGNYLQEPEVVITGNQ